MEPRWRVSITFVVTFDVVPVMILIPFSCFGSRVLSRDGDPHVEFLEDGQVLKVKSVRLRDQGIYQCLASNNAGTQMRQFRLTVQGRDFWHWAFRKPHYCSFSFVLVHLKPHETFVVPSLSSPEHQGPQRDHRAVSGAWILHTTLLWCGRIAHSQHYLAEGQSAHRFRPTVDIHSRRPGPASGLSAGR